MCTAGVDGDQNWLLGGMAKESLRQDEIALDVDLEALPKLIDVRLCQGLYIRQIGSIGYQDIDRAELLLRFLECVVYSRCINDVRFEGQDFDAWMLGFEFFLGGQERGFGAADDSDFC